jgi:hypothetical protein
MGDIIFLLTVPPRLNKEIFYVTLNQLFTVFLTALLLSLHFAHSTNPRGGFGHPPKSTSATKHARDIDRPTRRRTRAAKTWSTLRATIFSSSWSGINCLGTVLKASRNHLTTKPLSTMRKVHALNLSSRGNPRRTLQLTPTLTIWKKIVFWCSPLFYDVTLV